MTLNGCLKGLILTHHHQENTVVKGTDSNPDCLGLNPHQLCDFGQLILPLWASCAEWRVETVTGPTSLVVTIK